MQKGAKPLPGQPFYVTRLSASASMLSLVAGGSQIRVVTSPRTWGNTVLGMGKRQDHACRFSFTRTAAPPSDRLAKLVVRGGTRPVQQPQPAGRQRTALRQDLQNLGQRACSVPDKFPATLTVLRWLSPIRPSVGSRSRPANGSSPARRPAPDGSRSLGSASTQYRP